MIIIDTLLERRELERRPIQVALVGAGFSARSYAMQLLTPVRGMRLAVIANRNPEHARKIFERLGRECADVSTAGQLDDAIARNRPAVAEDPRIASTASGIDVVIEATGDVEFGAAVTLEAIAHRKHVVLSNAELDATLGPILKVYADRAGVVITYTDGDEPGIAMNLFRFVKSVGYRPLLAGNLKGFIDYRRNPDTQQKFAAENGLNPWMAASFADGTKLCMECAILANATGFRVARRGMLGYPCQHVNDVLTLFSPDDLLQSGGLVDYLLGAAPGTGAFVVGYNDEPEQQAYMKYFKMGSGPLYLFYTPYHLPQLQLPHSVARAVLFYDPTVTPMGAPVCEVVSVAKRNLMAGEELDGIGGFTCYGSIENAATAQAGDMLPMALSRGCRMKGAVPTGREIRYCDVEVPAGRLCDKLMAEQNEYFGIVRGNAIAHVGL